MACGGAVAGTHLYCPELRGAAERMSSREMVSWSFSEDTVTITSGPKSSSFHTTMALRGWSNWLPPSGIREIVTYDSKRWHIAVQLQRIRVGMCCSSPSGIFIGVLSECLPRNA
ncbi:hypothetical protein O3P69_008647 [Scylla paramamosain]|uniref:Uncharacterized protein n=1 Tax=Scylla paramamosain TaxID=85552 RepID=A0AAW0SLV6_SCYPA